MILPGTVPLDVPTVASEITQYLPDSWKPIIDTDIDGTHSLVGQVPILSTDGEVLAIASVSEAYQSVWGLLSGAGESLLVYLGLGAALGLIASWLLSRRIKRQTGGLEVA